MASDATTVNVKVKEPSYLEWAGRGRGLKSWILSTDHKRIGILYLISLTLFYAVGVVFGFLMRLELIAPGR
ncbi:MAG: cytochrome c oxidase subunit I, partial [Ignavibacteriales bacterium]